MTCLVAHKSGWMAADSRGTAGARIVPALFKKILRAKNPDSQETHTLLGLCGQANAFHDFEQLMPEAGQDVDLAPALLGAWLSERESTGKESYCSGLIVNNKGELYTLDSVGSYTLLLPEVDFYCDGSGAEVAYGYLYRIKELTGQVTPEDAVGAIKAAAAYSFTVGGPVVVESLYN